jgi:hypothetical protein
MLEGSNRSMVHPPFHAVNIFVFIDVVSASGAFRPFQDSSRTPRRQLTRGRCSGLLLVAYCNTWLFFATKDYHPENIR